MNNKPSRFLLFTICAMMLAAIGISAGAQDVLPLPAEARESGAPEMYGPEKGEIVTNEADLMWYFNGADRYAIKIQVIETGVTIKKTTQAADVCDINYCYVPLIETGLFNSVHNGQHVKWTVTAKSEAGNFKSETARFEVQTIQPAPLSSPSSGWHTPVNTHFSWAAYGTAARYKLVVEDVTVGQQVLKVSVNDASCQLMCDFQPAAGTLQPGHDYKWFVVSIAPNGDRAKSQKWTFDTLN